MRNFEVFEFRPIKYYSNLLRYADGKWIPDDGEYDLAFVGQDNGFPMGLYFEHPYYENILWSWCKKGNWGAYVSGHPRGNAWHYMMFDIKKDWGKNWLRRNHINTKAGDSAMNKCSSLYGCANGDGPEMHIKDPYIKQGVVRNRETKDILVFPKIFHCIYCGEIDWEKSEKMTPQEERLERIDKQLKELNVEKETLLKGGSL